MTLETTHAPDPIVRVVQQPLRSRQQVAEPMTIGVPFPRGIVRDVNSIGLAGDDGVAVRVQALPSERWPDGSVRWALLDFCSTGESARERSYRITLDSSCGTAPRDCLEIISDESKTIVHTGAATFTVARGDAFPFARVVAGGGEVLGDAHVPTLTLTDSRGRDSQAVATRVVVEEQGLLRST